MARYYKSKTLIEFVKKYTPHINGETTMECVVRAIREAPTADVVPKSEVDRLNAVMKEMDEQRAYTINMLGESLEKAKIEVEELSDRYEDLKLKHIDLAKDYDELIAWGGHIKSKDKEEIRCAVAREIFEELENHKDKIHGIVLLLPEELAELEKKYLEEYKDEFKG